MRECILHKESLYARLDLAIKRPEDTKIPTNIYGGAL
jgi:hypothetical protein